MSKQLILIIDDNPDDLFFIKEALEETFDIATATSAEEGLRKAEVLLPILIILDMNLGKANGYEVFEELKVSENTQTIPVIFNTGHHTEIDELKALRAGAIDYIEKSHSLDLLKQRVISITSLIKSTRDNTINSALPSVNKIQTRPNRDGLSDTDDTHSFDEFKNKLSIYEEEFTAQQESLEAQIELSRIESEKFSELFFYSPIGILHIDQNGKILLFNHLANIYLGGIRKGQIFYPKLLSLSEKNNSELFSWFYPQKGSPNEIELSIKLGDKSHIYKLTRSLFQGNHIFITIFDITEAYETRLREKQIQTQQQRLLERLALATDIAGLGTWKDDFVSNVYEIDEVTQNLLNIHKEKITLEELAEIVVPEDIPLVVEARQKAMQTQENDELYFRALVKNEVRYFYAKWRYFYDAEQLLNTIGFLKDITDEQKALEQANQLELQRQLNKAQKQITQAAVEANKNKTLFLANMSHEFRTPLHAINSFTSMAQKLNEASGFDKLPRYLDFIKTSTERLIRLVNDLLDLSRLEIGDIKLNKSPTNLLELSRSVIDELNSIAVTKKNIHINQTADDDLALINLDMGLINQLITNLISNALKFSPDGGLIEITIRKGQATLYGQSVPAVYYSVVDEGVGIPEEETEVIFDKFRQSTKTATGAGGTGLGLAICREIITLHDGKIYAVSPPPDKEKGAMLEFYLPIADSELKHDF